MFSRVWVAYHGRGEVIVDVVSRTGQTGHWGDWDYINSHCGEPQFWMPYNPPEPPKADFEGPHCGCDCCTEKYSDDDGGDGSNARLAAQTLEDGHGVYRSNADE